MTDATITQLIARLKVSEQEAYKRADGSNAYGDEWRALEAQARVIGEQKRTMDFRQLLLTLFMEEFELRDLTDEDYDAIEERAHTLWNVAKERDALRTELTACRAEIERRDAETGRFE